MSIESIVRNVIQKKGFITHDELIEIAMSRHHQSYYRAHQPIGPEKDFITAPEISQMFGEMIGVWCIDLWTQLSKPKLFNIVEYGAGFGTLMRDILRISQKNEQFYNSLTIWIIDINPHFKKKQEEVLKNYGINIFWVDSISKVSSNPTIIIANEFFDALPVKQYIKQKKDWKENSVIENPISGELAFDLRPIKRILEQHLLFEHQNAVDRAVLEESPISIKIIKEISEHIKHNTGGGLIIDYGYDINPKLRKTSQYTQTIQAVKKHKYTPILNHLGEADLSSHVDFWALKAAAEEINVKTYGSITQRELLISCGINIRLKALMNQNPNMSDILLNQYNRLVSPNQMGELFKAISITSNDQILPLGFHS